MSVSRMTYVSARSTFVRSHCLTSSADKGRLSLSFDDPDDLSSSSSLWVDHNTNPTPKRPKPNPSLDFSGYSIPDQALILWTYVRLEQDLVEIIQ